MVAEEGHVVDRRLELVGVHARLGGNRHALGADGQEDPVAGPAGDDPQRLDLPAADVDVADVSPDVLHPPRKAVVLADEPRHERAVRLFVEGLGRGDLLDDAGPEHRDPVRHHHRLVLVVGDVHHGDPEVAVDAADLVLQLLAKAAVEGAEGLVHQDQVRLEHEGARDGHALLLAARQLSGPPLLQAFQPYELEGAADAGAPVFWGEAAHLEGEGEVVAHRHVREEGVVLEHHADAAAAGRQVVHRAAGDADDAGGGRLEPGQHHQAGCLARSGGPEQGEELALGNLQVEVAHDQGTAVVALADAIEGDVLGVVRGPAARRRRGGRRLGLDGGVRFRHRRIILSAKSRCYVRHRRAAGIARSAATRGDGCARVGSGFRGARATLQVALEVPLARNFRGASSSRDLGGRVGSAAGASFSCGLSIALEAPPV